MRWLIPLGLAVLAGCAAPGPRVHLGAPYQAGGVWSYPREDFALDAAGIVAVQPVARGLTANGERRRDGLYATHRTLQLPAIVTLTNLENGRSLQLRVNDRGPADPGRVLGIAPRAAALLGARGPFQGRVVIDAAASRLAMAGLPGGDAPLPVATAPVGAVGRESLGPPGGAPIAAPARPTSEPVRAAAAPAPAPLPERVVQGVPRPGAIWLEAGRFHDRALAQRAAARLAGARVLRVPDGDGPPLRVRQGPFTAVPAANAALRRALALGLSEPRLVVEPPAGLSPSHGRR